ncbi:hypothetical protein ACHAWF_001309 [Thalassiosira exigua]
MRTRHGRRWQRGMVATWAAATTTGAFSFPPQRPSRGPTFGAGLLPSPSLTPLSAQTKDSEMNLNERNAHPRDRHVAFDPVGHAYAIKGSSEGVTSVTALLDSFFSAFDPDDAIAKYYRRWQKDPRSKYYGLSKGQIKGLWNKEGKMAADEGTVLHAAIEAFYNGSDVEYDIDRPEWKLFLDFQEEFDLVPHRTEMTLWSEEHKLGGTVDLVVANEDGTHSIYDWKRTKKEVRKEGRHFDKYGTGPLSAVKDNKYHRYGMQLNVYRELLERYYGCDVRSMSVVRLHPNARTFEVTRVERMEEETEAVLDHRRRVAVDTLDLETRLDNLAIEEEAGS